jgi:hypothetical protein
MLWGNANDVPSLALLDIAYKIAASLARFSFFNSNT